MDDTLSICESGKHVHSLSVLEKISLVGDLLDTIHVVRSGLFDQALALGSLAVQDDPSFLSYLIIARDKPSVISNMSYGSDVKALQDRLYRLDSLVEGRDADKAQTHHCSYGIDRGVCRMFGDALHPGLDLKRVALQDEGQLDI